MCRISKNKKISDLVRLLVNKKVAAFKNGKKHGKLYLNIDNNKIVTLAVSGSPSKDTRVYLNFRSDVKRAMGDDAFNNIMET